MMTSAQVSDKSAGILLITGASRGIGAATALLAASQGWDVAVHYGRDELSAQRVVEEATALGRRSLALQADLADEAAVRAMFERIDRDLGRLTGLVNNAGIVARRARLDEMVAARWRHMFEVNVLGTMLCAQLALLRMCRRHGGSGGAIVNISSQAAQAGAPGLYVDYAASKGAVDSFTLGLAREVAPEGVRVNAVRPGIIDTAIHADSGDPERAQRLAARIPMGRPGSADEVAQVVLWLLSPQASYCSGSIVDVTGGR